MASTMVRLSILALLTASISGCAAALSAGETEDALAVHQRTAEEARRQHEESVRLHQQIHEAAVDRLQNPAR